MPLYTSNFQITHDLGLIRSRKNLLFAPRMINLNLLSPFVARCDQMRNFEFLKQRSNLEYKVVQPRSMDEGSLGIPQLGDCGDEAGSDYMIFSSDNEDSDGEILVTSMNDVDMPKIKNQFVTAEDAVTATAHRFAVLGRRHRKCRITYGFVTSLGVILFLMFLLAFVDWCAWRIVKLPLDNFHFLSPFVFSAFLVACAGYVSVPILKMLDIRQKFERKGPSRHFFKKGPPTIGGLFFVPIGVGVAKVMSGSSAEVSGVLAVTLAFAAVGLLDDVVCLKKYCTFGLSSKMRFLLEVAIAAWFSFWLCTKDITSPYGILTDGLDGLAGGTSALAFVGMSIAVLPICSELSVFGASMAGACVGFLLHNRYKASVSMGKTGSLALGGALAAIASCSGMFFPLLIASGFLVLEVLAVIMQIVYFKVNRTLHGKQLWLSHSDIAPLHQHLQLWGIQKPSIVSGVYIISSLLAVLAGYIGLISA